MIQRPGRLCGREKQFGDCEEEVGYILSGNIHKKKAVAIKIVEKLTHLLLRKSHSLNQNGRYSILWEPLAIQACIECVSEHDDQTV